MLLFSTFFSQKNKLKTGWSVQINEGNPDSEEVNKSEECLTKSPHTS